jgi:hypothetical protein
MNAANTISYNFFNSELTHNNKTHDLSNEIEIKKHLSFNQQMDNQLQEMDVPPNCRFSAPNLSSKSPPRWGYESTKEGVFHSSVHSHNKLVFPTTSPIHQLSSPII